jgi:hypothetical protein
MATGKWLTVSLASLLVAVGCAAPTAVPTAEIPETPVVLTAEVEATEPPVTEAVPTATPTETAVAPGTAVAPQMTAVRQTATPTVTVSATSEPRPVSELRALVAAQALNVRSGPGVVYAREGALTRGAQVVLDGRDAAGSWAHGREAGDGLAGWLAADYLAVEGDVQALPILAAPPSPTPAPTTIPALATATAAAAPTPAPPPTAVVVRQPGACVANRLVNGDFEGGFSTRGRNEVVVADGWSPWYKTSPGVPGINHVPEYKPETAAQFGMRRIHSGGTAQKWFTTFATHTAGIFQQVGGIPMGSRLELSAWVQVWSSDEDNIEVSAQPGNYRVLVGIDPTGGTDWSSEDVAWSEPTFAYDAYKQLTVTAVARNTVVTVFLQGVPEFPVKHNDSYWDDVCLDVVAAQ